jgi:hypothetical protein
MADGPPAALTDDVVIGGRSVPPPRQGTTNAMTHPIRSIFALTILVIVLAACSTAVGAPVPATEAPSQPAAPSVDPTPTPKPADPTPEPAQPSQPEAPAEEERQVDGTITVAEGMVFSGPGGTIQEALDAGPSGEFPTLVNGVLFRDTDGRIYLATEVSDETTPTFGGPTLEVLNFYADESSWDMANAELLGLQEANGIVFKADAQILGFLEIS